nr:MAG TPA: hypothetical protein [Caudoviricetes sp.]
MVVSPLAVSFALLSWLHIYFYFGYTFNILYKIITVKHLFSLLQYEYKNSTHLCVLLKFAFNILTIPELFL